MQNPQARFLVYEVPWKETMDTKMYTDVRTY